MKMPIPIHPARPITPEMRDRRAILITIYAASGFVAFGLIALAKLALF